MKNLIVASALSLSLLPVSLASAQDASAPVPAPDVNYIFDDHGVDGTYQTPDGERIELRGRALRRSLIRARAHFIPELAGSIEHL